METVEEFLARGGNITQVESGEKKLSPRERYLMDRGESYSGGSYTDARMREAENMGTLDIQELRHEMRAIGER